jgi:hypothetical protein
LLDRLIDQPRTAREVEQIDGCGRDFTCAAGAEVVGDGSEFVGIATYQEERIAVGCEMPGGLLRDR